ncbi:histidine phosphatase family protein [Arthrobacter sp. zg-Y769]|uniref:histidine phosphatase family protein n=1 Tax=Arthrobacter sp. zg-Y769 TaxID=2894191 RepID=UPI001E5946BB|nr:histidine phosphatase family protein [Arthrobacter sp. zg-Y769]MCC9205727.1 histidine phosphatase family protein [Arthrobacter sp. zg-Y769]
MSNGENFGPAVPDLTPSGTRLPRLWLLRHGETEWSREGNYTGLTDIPLTAEGEAQARGAREKIGPVKFDRVLTSPLVRARRTAELVGYPDAEVVPHAHEWDYGDNEGRNSRQVRAENPGYLIWKDGVPNGETLAQVAQRADLIISSVQAGSGTAMDRDPGATPVEKVLLVAHGHFLRILAARWLGLPPEMGRHFALSTAAVCTLGWDKRTPAVVGWNL